MTPKSPNQPTPSDGVFRPALKGCVARDPRMAGMLAEDFRNCLCSIAANTYRAILTKDLSASSLFEKLIREDTALLRQLGELILALGGPPSLCAQLRVLPAEGAPYSRGPCTSQLLREALRENKRAIDSLQTKMGQTADRVVRSVLSQLLTDRHLLSDQILSLLA